MISKPALDTKDTGGVVGKPVYASATTIISTKSADTANSGTDLNQSYDHSDRAKKWELPHPHVVHEKARNQYKKV